MKNKIVPNIVEGPQGLPMPEPVARKIEALARTLPSDFIYRRIARKSDAFQLDAGERTDVSVITTDALDRDGEVILPGGIDWSDYNRVVTFCHRYDQLPVGSNWWIRARGATAAAPQSSGGLIAKTHYPQKPADWGDAPWLPSAVLHLMQQPVPTCTGKSIGFLPLNIRSATPEERSRRPELADVPIIDRAAGIEYAVAPVPCNPEAQMQAVSKGRELGLIDDELAALLAAPTTDTAGKAGVATLNEHAYRVARSLILSGDLNESDGWSFDAADEQAILGNPADWRRYAGCFLGIDPSSDAQTASHYKYPFAKEVLGKLTLFVHALHAIRSESAAQHDGPISEAAGRLLDLLHSQGKLPRFIRPATLRQAIEREVLAMRPELRRQIHGHIRDVFCAATGRVC